MDDGESNYINYVVIRGSLDQDHSENIRRTCKQRNTRFILSHEEWALSAHVHIQPEVGCDQGIIIVVLFSCTMILDSVFI